MRIKRGRTRWLLLLGGGLVLALLAVVAVLAYGQLAGGQAQASPQEPPDLQPAATSAFRTASREVQDWQGDAQLVGLVGHVHDVGKQVRGVDWAFQFYSPSTRRLALLVATDGEARMVRDVLSPYSVPTIPQGRWRIDSGEAMRIWWESGGRYLLARRPDSALALRLDGPLDGKEDPVWTVIGSIPDEGSDYIVKFSGFDGHLFEE